MNALRRSRSIGRYLAVWLLLWFVAMSARPVLPLSGAQSACLVAPAESGAEHAEHEGHEGHEDGHAQACSDTQEADGDGGHGGHAAGSPQHCPLCMHAAAPPPPHVAYDSGSVAPADPGATLSRVPLRVRATLPPPARAPPLLS
jgi:hypothetical protein